MVGEESPEELWRKLKWGKFSASEINDLMLPGTNTIFSQGGLTYIKRVAREAYTLFNDDENNESYAMRKGKMKEPEAYGFYRKLIGLSQLEYYGGSNPYFELYCPDSGSSPDCLAWIDQAAKVVSFGAEFKCPTSKIHGDYLEYVKDQFDLKKINPQYYGQCQFGMMTFKADLWHWCSYNEFWPIKDRMLIIEIKPDKPYQSMLAIRLKQAVKMKYEFIEQWKARA